MKWVQANGLWSCDNFLLVLCRWEKGITTQSVKFTHILLWVQVWGRPFDLINEEAGREVGEGVAKVLEVDCKAIASDQAHFLRLRVELPLDKLL